MVGGITIISSSFPIVTCRFIVCPYHQLSGLSVLFMSLCVATDWGDCDAYLKVTIKGAGGLVGVAWPCQRKGAAAAASAGWDSVFRPVWYCVNNTQRLRLDTICFGFAWMGGM